MGYRSCARAFLMGGLAVLSGCSSTPTATGSFPDATTSPTHPPHVDATTTPDTGSPLKSSPGQTAMCAVSTPDRAGCPCAIGETVSCYTGAAATRNTGTCRDGTETCMVGAEGFNVFGKCTGEVLPATQLSCWLAGDAGTVPDSGGATYGSLTAVIGQPCTPGQVQANPDAGAPGSTEGGGVYYCDTGGTWQTFPSGRCVPSQCTACLNANCLPDGGVDADTDSGCPESVGRAFAFISQCGPDRSTYFANLSMCGAVETLNGCKDTKCVFASSDEDGPCSFY